MKRLNVKSGDFSPIAKMTILLLISEELHFYSTFGIIKDNYNFGSAQTYNYQQVRLNSTT